MDRVNDFHVWTLGYSAQCAANPFEAPPKTLAAVASYKDHPSGWIKRQARSEILGEDLIVFNSGYDLLQGIDDRPFQVFFRIGEAF